MSRAFTWALSAAMASWIPATTARADGEAWGWLEYRLPVVRANTPDFPRLDLRIYAEQRLNGRSDGLAQSFLRAGPLLYMTNWLFVGLHGTLYAERLASGAFDQEARFELEPNLFGRLGDFTLNDRNRLEYRWRESGDRFRYRNQLRVNYAPIGATWIPFIWDEVLVDLSGAGLNQNRAHIGLGRMVAPNIRVDAGYLLRSREDPNAWLHDHVFTLSVFVDAPPAPAPSALRDG